MNGEVILVKLGHLTFEEFLLLKYLALTTRWHCSAVKFNNAQNTNNNNNKVKKKLTLVTLFIQDLKSQ